MSSNEFVPTIAGIVMTVFGIAMAAGMFKGIYAARKRRNWPVVPGRVKLVNSSDGHKNAIAQVRYTSPDGVDRVVELATGGLSSDAIKGKTIDVSVNPNDPTNAVPAAGASNLGTMGCFGLLASVFAIFGIFTLVYILTN